METNPDGSARNTPVPIYRSRPLMVNVMLEPMLTNENIEMADLVDVEGGWAIRIKLKDQGIRALEIASMRNRGKRLAVRAAFPQIRWLAAPILTRRIEDGIFIFTPDATREEAERIVRGINNTVKRITRNQLMK
jgi:hypothetical protein